MHGYDSDRNRNSCKTNLSNRVSKYALQFNNFTNASNNFWSGTGKVTNDNQRTELDKVYSKIDNEHLISNAKDPISEYQLDNTGLDFSLRPNDEIASNFASTLNVDDGNRNSLIAMGKLIKI